MKKSVFFIAEAGVNHNGSLERALELVDIAAAAGADAVKFQSFRADQVILASAPKADYQIKQTGAEETQFEMLKRLELSPEDHFVLRDRAKEKKIAFLSTPFDLESLSFLRKKMGLNLIKIASGEITNAPLLLAAAQSGAKLILSTGMCNLADIESALGVVAFGLTQPKSAQPSQNKFRSAYRSAKGRAALKKKVSLLHCVTDYPAEPQDINLRAMETMKKHFDLPIGFSDHTLGISISLAAVAMGATIIEKHFTTDKKLPGPDHSASLEPQELMELVSGIRQIEKSLGHGKKIPSATEQKNLLTVRRSLVTQAPIEKGELFSKTNIAIKRPGTGVSPILYWDFLGRKSKKALAANQVIKKST